MKHHDVDPLIKLNDALALFDDNQSQMADALDLSRSVVNEWVKSGRELVPPLHAHRLVALFPDIPTQEPDTCEAA